MEQPKRGASGIKKSMQEQVEEAYVEQKDLWKERIIELKAEMLEYFPELDDFQRAQLVIQIVNSPSPVYHVTMEER